MKCLLLADNRPELLDALEPILKHWGYRVLAASDVEQANTFLAESEPCMVIVGAQLLGDKALQLKKSKPAKAAQLPLVALAQDEASTPIVKPDETLETPVDIFTLFSFIQQRVEQHPRQNLRLPVRMPGMYRNGTDSSSKGYILADVLSLSMQGLFFKAATRMKKGDCVTVVVPLLGHCKELELEGTILYVVHPDTENNFAQGFGVGFTALTPEEKTNLHSFIEDRFLGEVSSSQPGVGRFSKESLRH
jgi:Tfp pilus assembly protein PilZ